MVDAFSNLWATQYGGLARYDEDGRFIFVELPKDYPGEKKLSVGDPVPIEWNRSQVEHLDDVICDDCNGKGYIGFPQKCGACEGAGHVAP